MIITRAFKKHKYIIFELDDGKTVKYDLSTGKTIGKLGKEVKSIAPQLSGHNVYDVINSFEDENYKKFLRFVLKNFINKSSCGNYEVNKITNAGTFLSKLNDYSHFEQYFAAGICNIDPKLSYKLNEIPKQLVKWGREYNILIENRLIKIYNNEDITDSDNSNIIKLFSSIIPITCDNLSYQNKCDILTYKDNKYKDWSNFYKLIDNYNYEPKALIKYIDYLMTYEALSLSTIFGELKDYAYMMSKISPKYDKYPRNFLTTHQIAIRNYNRLKEQFNEESFKNRINNLLEWKNDDYVFIYPKTIQDIKDEAVMQNNCVASYVQRVIDGKCDILFMRNKTNINHSLVTLEVKNNFVVQAKGRFNRDVTDKEEHVINKYNKYLSKQMEAILC